MDLAAEQARFRAWDCDANKGIPADMEATVFEEVATMDFPFEGIATVPPRKDMSHMVRWPSVVDRDRQQDDVVKHRRFSRRMEFAIE